MQSVQRSASEAETLVEFYRRVRGYTEQLCEPLETEDFVPQASVDVSPPKWNIAHTTWFFEEMILKKFIPDYQVFDETFGFLFNSYYNSVGERTLRDRRGHITRPTVERVFAYRKYVDQAMLELLDTDTAEFKDLVILGLNHEQQHQELFLTDLKFTLFQNPLFPVYRENFAPIETIEDATANLINVAENIYEVGHDGIGFSFDNEHSRHKVYLNDYAICDRLVTNREFIDFIDDGSYEDPLLWHAEGWDWVCRERVNSPLYWINNDGEWKHFTLGGLRGLPPDAPVGHVSMYEAAAFAEWKGMRLPTEFEWEAANTQFNWGHRWEWTNSAYLPYPGFKKPAGAVGEYNGKFMINQMVLRGASAMTPKGHSRPTYRNFFHPHLRWQFTGIRLARS